MPGRAATIGLVRRNPSTVIVLASPVPAEVLTRIARSMNVTLVPPAEPADADDAVATAAATLRQAARAASPYALVAADPLAAVADGWRSMWDVSRPPGPAGFEQEAAKVLSAWRAGLFELPDYYLATATSAGAGQPGEPDEPSEPGPDFHLGPLRSVRPHRVAFVAAAEPAQQAAGILHTLGSLRPGRWWPDLDEVIETARGFYPGRLAETAGP